MNRIDSNTYDAEDLKILEAQEQALAFRYFDRDTAKELGETIVQIDAGFDEPVAILITSEPDGEVLFSHIMEGKSERNIGFALRKRNALLLHGHSSEWEAVRKLAAGEEIVHGTCAYTAGAFPVKVNGELRASISVSGLHEGQDHTLLLAAIAEYLHVDKDTLPVFSKIYY